MRERERVCVCAFVLERERERESVCVCFTERERERNGFRFGLLRGKIEERVSLAFSGFISNSQKSPECLFFYNPG